MSISRRGHGRDNISCHHDGCEETFEHDEEQTAQQKRLAHCLREHWDIDPAKYRYLTGEKYF